MDRAAIAGGINQALTEASGSIHFREQFSELGDALILEYHFTRLPAKIDLWRIAAAFSRVEALSWSDHHGESRLNLDGVIDDQRVTVFISLKKDVY
jgi:hypothetical protein